MKKLLLLVIGIITLFLAGCSEALNCNQCNNNNGDEIGTLPNGAVVYIDKNNVAVSSNSPAQINVYVVGGDTNEDFNISFSDSQLQQSLTTADSNGISFTPKSCILNNYNKTSCTIIISALPTTQAWLYAVTPTASSISTGKTTTLSPISILVSNVINDNSKDITSFIINNTQATIDQDNRTISLTLPYGTNLANLAPVYVTTGVSVSVNGTKQTNGSTVNNFTQPVDYVVLAQDGTTKTYTVTVNAALNNAKQITYFEINNNIATINQNNLTIDLTLPDGTNLNQAFVATYTTTGSKVMVGSTDQTSQLTPNIFANPVNYTVYAADGSSQTYKVTVTVSGDGSGGWKDVGEPGFSTNEVEFVNLIMGSNGIPYVGYRTPSQQNKLTVNSFNTSTQWSVVGSANFTPNGVINFSMAMDVTNNVPYLIYLDGQSTTDMRSMYLSNSQWSYYPSVESSYVGNGADFTAHDNMEMNPVTNQPGMTYVSNGGAVVTTEYSNTTNTWNTLNNVSNAKSPVISYDSNGVMYLAYISTNGGGIYIESSNNWNNPIKVADYDVNQCKLYCLSLTVNPATNQPAIAYMNNNNVFYTYYNNGSSTWSSATQVSSGEASAPDLAFNSSGTPYIAYIDNSNPSKAGSATVMSMSGSSWSSVGNMQFSPGAVNYLNLVINPQNNRPYVAYKDMQNAGKASAMYFAGNLN